MNALISKYLHNSATEEEKEILLQWLEEKEENKYLFKEKYDAWLYDNAASTSDSETEAALIRFNEYTSPRWAKNTPLHSFSVYFMRIAAAFLLLFLAGLIGYNLNNRDENILVMNKLLTGEDGKGQFVLPDGSTVWLNANSLLEYPEAFTDGKRKVRLEGEALFDIKENKESPFIVQTEGVDVAVLGTCFLVRNYSLKQNFEVVLVRGSVKVAGDYFPDPRILTPGQLIAFNKNTGLRHLRTVNTADYTNWIHSKLVFDNDQLDKIIINLEKWYGIEVVASPEFAQNTHLSFTVRREPLDEVLKYMSLTALIDYRWENDVLHLYPKE